MNEIEKSIVETVKEEIKDEAVAIKEEVLESLEAISNNTFSVSGIIFPNEKYSRGTRSFNLAPKEKLEQIKKEGENMSDPDGTQGPQSTGESSNTPPLPDFLEDLLTICDDSLEGETSNESVPQVSILPPHSIFGKNSSSFDFEGSEKYFDVDSGSNDDADERETDSNDPIYVPSAYSSPDDETPAKKIKTLDPSKSKREEVATERNSNPHKERIQVQSATDSLYKSRKNYCPYCLELQAQLPRHMSKKHQNEAKVIKFMSYPKNSVERMTILDELRNLGNFKHNANVLRTGEGEILPSVRPKKNSDGKDYVPCKNCLGFYPKAQLWRHNAICKKTHKTHLVGRRIVGHGLNLLMDNSANKVFLEKVVGSMITDHINLVIRNDFLILKLGENMFMKHSEISKYNYIRNRMRELGRLLLVLRETDSSIRSLKDAIHPHKFRVIVSAAKQMAGFDGVSQCERGSVVLKIGSLMKKCAEILSGLAMDKGDEELIKNCEYFIKRYDREWADSMSSLVLRDSSAKKFNRPEYLPLVEDFQTLNAYVESQTNDCYKKLLNIKQELETEMIKAEQNQQKAMAQPTWYKLAKLILSSLVMLNRKRSGDAERIKLENFEKGLNTSPSWPDVRSSRSDFDKAIAKYFHKIEVSGRRGIGVPVILSENHVAGIRLLIQLRNAVGVSPENDHVFPRPNYGSVQSIRGSEVFREVIHQAGVKKPEIMLSSNLRRHIATMSQILNLSSSELEELFELIGYYDVRIHADFHRLADDSVQLARVTKLLVALQRGTALKYRNRSFSEIEIDPEELVTDVSDNEETEKEDSEEWTGGGIEETQTGINAETMGNALVVKTESTPTCDPYHLSSDEEAKKCRRRTQNSRRMWSESEEEVTTAFFQDHLTQQKLPGKQECCECISQNQEVLQNRKWSDVKNFIRNKITAINRNSVHLNL